MKTMTLLERPILTRKITLKPLLLAIPLLILISLAIAILNFYFPVHSIDWNGAFYPAIQTVFSLKSPYEAGTVFNPPWAYLLLSPLALFPVELGGIIMQVINFLVFGLLAWKMGAKPLALAAIVFSPQVITGAIDGNIDWLVCLGFFMPPWLGLFFVLIKPQMGIAVAVFWLFQSWREGGLKRVVLTFYPVTIAFLLSFLAYGPWPLMYNSLQNVYWNSSMWPQSIPIGLVLLVSAIQGNRFNLAMMVSPFLAPYLVNHSWIVAILGLLPNQWLVVAAVVGMWLKALVPLFIHS